MDDNVTTSELASRLETARESLLATSIMLRETKKELAKVKEERDQYNKDRHEKDAIYIKQLEELKKLRPLLGVKPVGEVSPDRLLQIIKRGAGTITDSDWDVRACNIAAAIHKEVYGRDL